MNEAAPSRALIRAVLRRRIPVLVGCGVLACLHQGGEALVAVLIGVVVDRAIDGGSVSTLLFWLAVLAVDFAVLSGSFRWGSRLAQREAELVAHDLREDLVGRVLHPAGDLATGSRAGELSTLAVQDTKRVGTLMMTVPLAVAAVAAVVVSAVALLVSSVPLGLLVLLGTPLLLVLSRLASRPLEARSGDEQRDVALATGVATDLVRGLRVLKGFGAEATATERYTRASRRSLAATVRAARAGAALNGAVPAMTGVFIAVVAGVGGVLAVRGDLSVGGLVAAVGLAQFLLGPLTLFSMVTAGIAQARASAARIADALPEAPTAHHDADPLAPTTGGRRVEIVGARIGDRPPLCLTVDAGDLVGLVVPDRAASADLLAVLAGEAQRETLRLDGIAADRVPPTDLRTEILVERHDAALFRGSVEDNVRPARSTAPVPAGVWSATAADEVVACLPDAADTDIGERGLSLSGGQRQRVALARALAVDSPVLVLDEPTTAVDSVTEARIAAGIRDLRQGRTTIVLTTSPLLLAATDVVHLVLPDGTVASGRHQDLARDHPGYRAAVMTR